MTKELRRYQLNAKNAFFKATDSGVTKALITMATGLGKTYTAAEIYQEWHRRKGGRAMFVVHQVEITEQALEEFQEHLPSNIICGLLTADRAEAVNTCDILFTTFQSMHERTRRLFERNHFNLIIADEAHHGQAATYKPVLQHFNAATILGLTATPKRADGQDITEVVGEEIFSYSLAEGVVDGHLARMDYRVESDNLDHAKLQELVNRVTGGDRRVSKEDIDATIFLHERLEAIAAKVRQVEDEAGRSLKKIIFCRNLTHVREVHEHFPDAVQYHSKMKRKTQRDILNEFRSGEVNEILVRDKFNEGVDIPDAEMLVFLRGTESETIWLQQLGRGLRRTDTKDSVIILDFVANCDRLRAVAQLRDDIITASTSNSETEDNEKDRPLIIENSGWKFTFTEEIRNVIELLSRNVTEATNDGFLHQNGEVWATLEMLARILKLSSVAIRNRSTECRKQQGKDKGGRIWMYYSVNDVRAACADILQDLPRAGEDGTFEVDGEVWALLGALSLILNISYKSIERRCTECRKLEGKTKNRRISTFYALNDVRAACADLLQDLPQAGKEGTFEVDGEVWITLKALARSLKIHISGIKNRVGQCRYRSGKVKQGHIATFYALNDVRAACADLLNLPQTGEDGTFEADGEVWATVTILSKILKISKYHIDRHVSNFRQRKGRTRSGVVETFYALSDVKKATENAPRNS